MLVAMQPGFDVAQVCENGHVITTIIRSSPQVGRQFCTACGAPTLQACRQCGEPIPGEYHTPGFLRHVTYTPPKYCGACGKPFPWTETTLSELREFAKTVDGLSDEDRKSLEEAIDDLARDTPRTERAALTVRLLVPKLSQEAWSAMRAILVSVATEAAKRGMGL